MSSDNLEILNIDPYLERYKSAIEWRNNRFNMKKKALLKNKKSLSDFADGYLYFGFHQKAEGWVYREWAPNAKSVFLIGDFNGWDRDATPLKPLGSGRWEVFLPGKKALPHGSRVKVHIKTKDQSFDRVPLYCKRVIQDKNTFAFDGQIWNPEQPYKWHDKAFHPDQSVPPLIYEAHIGIAGESPEVSTFKEFTQNTLPHIAGLGYNAVQLMAIMEHPYYASFGYQVSNFFAVSSRFGTPEDLKALIDTAHHLGIAVILDLVHSHASRNVLDGIGEFDGTDYQFFHAGPEGDHPAWGSKVFNYDKPEVLHFLLSNIKFWLDEYHFDGFRFDGVTSILYHNHGLGVNFNPYDQYFSSNTDMSGLTYLQMASALAKEIKPDCFLIAEDMSGLPGMALPVSQGGLGFDYRLGMGLPDFWIHTLRDLRDEDWDLNALWHELTQRRPGEKVIGYAESHDQAIVGDKTIMFWLADQDMYSDMNVFNQNPVIERALALHKMIRLITCTCAGEGYMNFMGNEFGHPEWIDFPREENGWSYQYARRQWHLAEDTNLRYRYLQDFDRAMIHFVKETKLLEYPSELLLIDTWAKLLLYSKGPYLFAFNFHPTKDFNGFIPLPDSNGYQPLLNTESRDFGGWMDTEPDLIDAKANCPGRLTTLYIPKRSAAVYAPAR